MVPLDHDRSVTFSQDLPVPNCLWHFNLFSLTLWMEQLLNTVIGSPQKARLRMEDDFHRETL